MKFITSNHVIAKHKVMKSYFTSQLCFTSMKRFLIADEKHSAKNSFERTDSFFTSLNAQRKREQPFFGFAIIDSKLVSAGLPKTLYIIRKPHYYLLCIEPAGTVPLITRFITTDKIFRWKSRCSESINGIKGSAFSEFIIPEQLLINNSNILNFDLIFHLYF